MKLSELIKKYRTKNHLTMQEFADRANLSKGYISQLENEYSFSKGGNRMIPSLLKLNQIADAMKISLDDLLRNIDDMNVSLSDNDSYSYDDTLTEIPMDNIIFDDYFPLHYWSGLSAGSFEELIEAEPDSVVYVPITFQNKKKRLHAFKINGTSMNNVIPDGSIVISEDNYNNAIKYTDGTIVVAFMDGTATVKRLYSGEDSITLSPDSTDKSHMPIIVPKDKELVIIGKVIWHMNPEDIAEKCY